ncbi:MAG: penicillin-binding protein 2 [Odoribacteraceae bacterium]|jgi:penicillin-binding protein 2|nr:penicillin-binding protein 2 [Odoribacteraceae bacterium]
MDKFGYRKGIIAGIVVTVCTVYIIQLFHFQVLDDTYKIKAENNSQRVETLYPARGLIYDRERRLLVDNQAAYDLIMLPRQVKRFDTTELLAILGISREFLERNIAKCKEHSPYKPSVLVSQIAGDRYAVLQEKLYRYPGFYIQTRTLRKYHVNHSGDLFGYISEAGAADIEKDPYYAAGDYIGTTGLERTFEWLLRGKKGKKIVLVDNFNREKGSFANGEYDEVATVGEDLYTTLDIDLQSYANLLMQNKKGGIVAIEPKTGEILAKLSAPGYDPRMIVGQDLGRNYPSLQNDPLKPLYDRTTKGRYPPGSTFKPLQALIGLEMGVITPGTLFPCNHGAYIGRFVACHGHKSPVNLREAIETSCNPYFINVFSRVLESPRFRDVRDGYNEWRKYIIAFGLGVKVSADFEEDNGLIPTQEYYDLRLKTRNWYSSYINSLAIGQGELAITPMQMANFTAALANRGYYITPHIASPTNDSLRRRVQRHEVPVDRAHFEVVIEGMRRVVTNGTGWRARVDSVAVAGKTGTAENPHGKDHSVFIAFAPADDPAIALVVYVEHGEWGATYAAAIAGLLIEKYLKGTISGAKRAEEKRIIETNLIFPGS